MVLFTGGNEVTDPIARRISAGGIGMGTLLRSGPRTAGVGRGRLGALTLTLGGIRLLGRGAGAPARLLDLLLAMLGLPPQFARASLRRLGLRSPAL